jgi:hypothetical protein
MNSLKSVSIVGAFVIISIAVLTGNIQSALALSGTYNYASSGSYYTEYGPTQYWHTATNAGYCGHISASCSPNSMKWTYNSDDCFVSNSAYWDNIDSANNGIHKVFIPGVNATTASAPYGLTYNGASTYTWTINQNAYYDTWIQTGTFYDIRNTWLTDATCEGDDLKKVGFDEVRIVY